jgi:monovalent cation:H+ antiporter, CPA1 family
MTIEMIVFGLAGLLMLVCFMPPLAGMVRLPYTLILAICGLLLGYFFTFEGWAPPLVKQLLVSLQGIEISSEMFLVVFLPILLFETALNMNVRRMLDDIAPILLLAVVAVVVSTAFVGAGLFTFTDQSLIACLLLGSIIATTDPGAVVSIFKEVGAPKRLVTIVEGESLLNDAAAIALFAILIGILTHERQWEINTVLGDFARLFLGGAIAGYAIGRIACFMFRFLRGWPTAEISLTLAIAYLSYIVPEHFLGVSGVVSTVTAGLVIGSVGRTRITATTFASLSQSWQQFGFWANSLIFLFATMIIPKLFSHFTIQSLVVVGIIFVATLFARALVVFGILPVLTWAVGTRVNTSYKTVIWWGGLRGALSLALALSVTEHSMVAPAVREFVALGVTGYVLVTLLINGVSLRPLIRLLKLDKLSPTERLLRNQAMAVATTTLQKETERIALNEQISKTARARINSVFEASISSSQDTHIDQFTETERVNIGLTMLARREFEAYFNILKENNLDPKVAEFLLSHTERMEDAIKLNGVEGFKKAVYESLKYPRTFRFAIRLHNRIGIHRALAQTLTNRFARLVIMSWVVRKLSTFADEQIRAMIGDEAAQSLMSHTKWRANLVEENLQALRLQYPTYADWLEEKYLGQTARSLERRRYRSMLDESLIGGEVYDDLVTQLERRWRFLDREPSLDVEMTAAQLIARVPLLTDMSAESEALITKLLRPRFAIPHELILGAEKSRASMYFVASGAVSVLLPDDTHIELGSGEFFGELALLTDETIKFEVRSLGYTKLLELTTKDFKLLLSRDKKLKEVVDKVVAERVKALKVWRDQPQNW